MRKLIYVMVALFLLGCSSDTITDNSVILEKKGGNGKGKGNNNGNPQEIAFATSIQNLNEIGNIAVYGGDYFGELPNNYGNPVDFDGDGVNDTIEVLDRKIVVNGVTVNNNLFNLWVINGFTDVDNDGDLDIIVEHGAPRCYNVSPSTIQYWDSSIQYLQGEKVRHYTEGCCPNIYQAQEDVIGGLPPSESTSWRLEHSVLYNEVDQLPLSIAEILQSLVLVADANNPSRITWDISEFGFECYPFSLQLLQNGQVISSTAGYGEFGIDVSSIDFAYDQLLFTKYGVILDLP